MSLSGSLSASALIPQEGYARQTGGFGINGGMWLQMGHLVVEPRASFRADVANEKREYRHLVPLEVSTYWFNRFDDTAVFIGPGANLQYVQEEVDLKSSVGSEIVATSERRTLEFQYCFGVLARAGVVFGSSKVASPMLSVEYALTFLDFEKTSLQRGIHLNFGVLFGRGR